MRYQRDFNRNRWLAYFDLLGVRRLLANGKELDVFVAYDIAIKNLRDIGQWTGTVRHAWFSDTFLIWAPDDSSASFRDVDQMARIFTDSLLQKYIPLRGAVSCGSLYADVENEVFFGNALVEAYEYGEGQDWIGLLLCPSVTERLDALGVSINQTYYASFSVPWKRRPGAAPVKLHCCVIGNWTYREFGNPYIPVLQQMMSRCNGDAVRIKYERTIEFLKEHPRENG